MDPVAIVCSSTWFVAVAILIFRAVRQRDLLPRLGPAAPLPASAAPMVAVIVPARDEAENIGPCLRTLLAQDYPPDRYVIMVVDDHSTDGTPEIVAALRCDRPGLSLLRSPSLPRGWTGKSHACWLGIRAVAPAAGWFCFIDADMRAGRGLLTSAVRAANAERLDLLSLAPRHEIKSFAERLVIPCGLFVLAFLQDLGSLQSPGSRDVSATGQFMLMRTEAYHAIGGHAAVRGEICEDLALARRCRRAGYRVLIKDGAPLLSGRMYTGWRTLWPGFAKNVIDMLGGARATAATAMSAVVLAWAAPIVPALAAMAYVHDPGVWTLMSLVCSLLASAAIFPLGYTAGALIAADSIRRRRRARVAWKGRVYS
jgi:chlorobactene glucosyltransferase